MRALSEPCVTYDPARFLLPTESNAAPPGQQMIRAVGTVAECRNPARDQSASPSRRGHAPAARARARRNVRAVREQQRKHGEVGAREGHGILPKREDRSIHSTSRDAIASSTKGR